MQNNIDVLKFGGAVLNSAEGFRKMLQIVNNYRNKKALIVVSAFGKSTRILTSAARIAETGDYVGAISVAEECVHLYTDILTGLNICFSSDSETDFLRRVDGLKNLLRGISITGELTSRTLDAVISCGENFALGIASAALLHAGVPNIPIASSELIKTDSRFGRAVPDLELSRKLINEKLAECFRRENIVITQGFVASDINGEITTMGLESSNLSAALFAVSLKASEFIVYTDVRGIRNFDPKRHDVTELIPKLSYRQAKFAGQCGLKLIFPAMIDVLQAVEMQCKIASAFDPSGECTIIGKENADAADAIITLEDFGTATNELQSGKFKMINDFPVSEHIYAQDVTFDVTVMIALNSASTEVMKNQFLEEICRIKNDLAYAKFSGSTAVIIEDVKKS